MNGPVDAAMGEAPRAGQVEFMGVPFDVMKADHVLHVMRRRSQADRFAYVVTPNVDHVVRLTRTPNLRPAYYAAWMSWCDSQPIRQLARLRGHSLPLLTGSDMTVRLFADVVRPGDRVVCITADNALLVAMRTTFPQCNVAGYSPPQGIDDDPEAFAACVNFIVTHPARFVFIGIGSPRSERLAYAVQQTGGASGTALCVGGALEFLTGRKQRAPEVLRRFGLEWLHRLSSEPRRLWRRYVFAVAPLSMLFLREMLWRRRI